MQLDQPVVRIPRDALSNIYGLVWTAGVIRC
jgi:hypothetical protein